MRSRCCHPAETWCRIRSTGGLQACFSLEVPRFFLLGWPLLAEQEYKVSQWNPLSWLPPCRPADRSPCRRGRSSFIRLARSRQQAGLHAMVLLKSGRNTVLHSLQGRTSCLPDLILRPPCPFSCIGGSVPYGIQTRIPGVSYSRQNSGRILCRSCVRPDNCEAVMLWTCDYWWHACIPVNRESSWQIVAGTSCRTPDTVWRHCGPLCASPARIVQALVFCAVWSLPEPQTAAWAVGAPVYP